jgi:hypothetical protein
VTLWSTRCAWPLVGIVTVCALLVHLVATTACDLPILHTEKPTACGYYPVYCDAAHTRCCPEKNACHIERDGSQTCEYVGDEPAQLHLHNHPCDAAAPPGTPDCCGPACDGADGATFR